MKISRETLLLEANRTGFRAEVLEKVLRLIDLLNAFANDEFLRSRIALKGGTALNLFYFDLPRLSVDIDLNYIGSSDRQIMLNERPQVIAAIEVICSKKLYRTKNRPSAHAGEKWVIGYQSALVKQGQLEIDLNFISRVSLWPIRQIDSVAIGVFQAVGIPVLDYHDLIGGKFSALFARHKSRDLFDSYTIFTHPIKPDPEKMKLSFLIYGAASRKDIRCVTVNHIHFDAAELKNMLLPVLRKRELETTPNFKTWANNMISICSVELEKLIRLNESEREFLGNLIDHGVLSPTFITRDDSLISTINQHPVLLWKAKNVRQMLIT